MLSLGGTVLAGQPMAAMYNPGLCTLSADVV
jgi:hypothetical protein